jgi:hypothetical protein
MQRSKWILGILATILLGALGSGLWSVVFEPTLGWCGKAFLTLVTLGVSAARDSVYARAARGYVEFPSVILMEFMVLLFAASALTWVLLNLPWASKPQPAEKAHRAARLLRWQLLFICLGSAIVVVQCEMVGYAMKVHSYFRQSLTICRPFIPQHDENVLSSRYARMKTRNDFVLLYGELQNIAQTNNVELPPFSPW